MELRRRSSGGAMPPEESHSPRPFHTIRAITVGLEPTLGKILGSILLGTRGRPTWGVAQDLREVRHKGRSESRSELGLVLHGYNTSSTLVISWYCWCCIGIPGTRIFLRWSCTGTQMVRYW